MKFARNVIAASIALAALTGCNDNDSAKNYTEARFATYNLSFDRVSYKELVAEMTLSRQQQDNYLVAFHQGVLDAAQQKTAKNIIQIRNVAETIQRTRPNVFLLAEFNNKGTGEDMEALNGFHDNYLAHAQNSQVKSIRYQYRENFATNTGKPSGFDLDNDGKPTDVMNDAWGFGFYHGQYAFAVFSQFEIDSNNIRTFQDFKWKDMEGMSKESNLEITECNDPEKPIPENRQCGDDWYSQEAWEKFPLSSKNHADVPVIIPTPSGEQVIHFLVSHPAPPISNNAALHNNQRNRDEIQFWNDYIDSKNYMYDDNGFQGGLAAGSKFVVAGDLNADPIKGDGILTSINGLLSHSMVNTEASLNAYAPQSNGGEYCLNANICKRNQDTPHPQNITSTSGLRLDYVIPSSNLEAVDSGVFWPAVDENGYHLVYDESLADSKGNAHGKSVSSDHRLVWMDFDLTK